MKTIKKYINISLLVALSIVSSCEYDSVNVDPTRPQGGTVTPNAIIPVMQTQTHKNTVAVLGRFAGILTQQWIGFDAQQVAYTSYVIGETDADNPWNTGLFVGSLRSCVDIIDRAEETQNLQSQGLAKIYLAVNLGIATNVWGDIPFSEAFLGAENLFPSYDSQESVYESIIRLLNEAESDLNSGVGNLDGDLVNSSNWVGVARALKARFYLHLVKRNPNAAQLALDAINSGAMSGNSDQADFAFEASVNAGNPLAIFGIQRPNTMIIDPQFETFMNGDPRKDLYMVEDEGDFLYYDGSLFWSRLNSPVPLITFAEQKFIESEALLRTGGDGTSALREAVTANMQYLGIEESVITAYVSALTLNGSLEQNIETIINEKYKALYGNSPIEVWNDFRRTGYPSLTPNAGGVNGLNPSGIIPRRLLYPISERVSNPDAYQAAIDAQGGHLLDDDIWIWPSN